MKTRLLGRFPKLACIWLVLRGHQVAYNIKIVDGGVVLDSRPAALIGVQIIRPKEAAVRMPADSLSSALFLDMTYSRSGE